MKGKDTDLLSKIAVENLIQQLSGATSVKAFWDEKEGLPKIHAKLGKITTVSVHIDRLDRKSVTQVGLEIGKRLKAERDAFHEVFGGG